MDVPEQHSFLSLSTSFVFDISLIILSITLSVINSTHSRTGQYRCPMSAKVFYHKTPSERPILNHIPTEIWIRIMEYAGGSGLGLYDPNMTASRAFSFIRANERRETKELRSSLIMRSRMSRVSKAWYTMACPLLFQYIHLKKTKGVDSLRNALESTPDNDSQECALGWWTRRLDINLCDNEYNIKTVLQNQGHIADLVGFLPRLEILTFSTVAQGYITHQSSQILDSLSCRKSLKVVIWYTNCLPPSDKSWTHFLERHDQLEMIRGPASIEPTNGVQLNALKILHPLLIRVYPQDLRSVNLTQVDLPSLKWISYVVEELPRVSLRTIRTTIFDLLGEKLVAVQILHYTVHPTIARNHITSVMDKMRDTCHNLLQLNLVLRNWSSFINSTGSLLDMPDSVTKLCIRTLLSQVSNSHLKQLLHDTLPAVKSRNPNLVVVQLLDEANIEKLYFHFRALEDGLKNLKGLGIMIQDHNGQNLTPKMRDT
ncbi:hypothetical protein JR316_0011853 [Psilocybe cubensis]|uniref:Uncharacterized protein n=2 Tax=Psilocybe cubensis TaxID=181762 RepID=A0ACB8GLE0_PSICU|nr:hypothetical protein JR316_0011853 [Psilocybe cubensis]KAH9476280.1 hypothetical protein JR316_0011853 [Psilocybe cubensis]